VERGWGVNSSEDARHCSVLYICKYFEVHTHSDKSTGICGIIPRIYVAAHCQKYPFIPLLRICSCALSEIPFHSPSQNMELHTVRNTMLFVFRIRSYALLESLVPYYYFYRDTFIRSRSSAVLERSCYLLFRIGNWAL
jgi:hypothetical protein